MGFLRMQQSNFGGAISYLTQAEQNGYRDKSVESSLETSRFWFTMSEANQAVTDELFELATSKYRAALAMRPGSTDALMGLAGLLTKEQQYGQATEVYASLLKQQPKNPEVWRGLLLSYARDGQNDKMLALAAQAPPEVRKALESDPDYLRTLAAILQRAGPQRRCRARSRAGACPAVSRRWRAPQGRYPDAVRRHPDGCETLQSGHRDVRPDSQRRCDQSLRMDGTCQRASHDGAGRGRNRRCRKRCRRLSTIPRSATPTSFPCSAPSTSRPTARRSRRQLIERAAKLQSASGAQPSLQLQMQLAGIYLKANNTDQGLRHLPPGSDGSP